jgi:hypothetical protein
LNSSDIIGFFNLPKPSSRTMGLGSTQPLTEMSIRNLPGGKPRPAPKVDNLTAICERLLSRKCGILCVSQPYRPLRPVMGDSFTLCRRNVLPVRYELDCKYCYK